MLMTHVRDSRGRWALMLSAVALLVAGCGSSGAGVSGTGTSGGPSPAHFATDAYKYSACMRDHGVENFPDPVVSSSAGQTSVRLSLPAGTAQSPQFTKARTACRGLIPALKNGSQQTRNGPPLKDVLGFAECMRSHGIANFPDPTAQGRLSVPMITAAGIDLQAPGVRTAALACVPASHGALTRADIERALAPGASQGTSSQGTSTQGG
jgi:hypothetical protein